MFGIFILLLRRLGKYIRNRMCIDFLFFLIKHTAESGIYEQLFGFSLLFNQLFSQKLSVSVSNKVFSYV